jgi:hypothetical protein
MQPVARPVDVTQEVADLLAWPEAVTSTRTIDLD